MTRSYSLLAAALLASVALSAQAQGIYMNDGPVIDRAKATVAAYESGDWATYRASFADSVVMVNNNVQLSIDERIAEHQAIHEVFSDVHFENPIFGAAEMDGETWTMFYGLWTGTVRSSGENVQIMVHVATRQEDGKTVEEYGYWDTAAVGKVMEAAMGER